MKLIGLVLKGGGGGGAVGLFVQEQVARGGEGESVKKQKLREK